MGSAQKFRALLSFGRLGSVPPCVAGRDLSRAEWRRYVPGRYEETQCSPFGRYDGRVMIRVGVPLHGLQLLTQLALFHYTPGAHSGGAACTGR